MKLIRFEINQKEHFGILEKDKIIELQDNYFNSIVKTDREFDLNSVKILPPCEPSKIVCAGLNYKDHAKEMNHEIPDEPVIFIKPATCVIGQNEPIILPEVSNKVDFEAELAIVIKKKCKNLNKDNFQDYILGYTCLNDVTARDLQKKDGQWTRAKSFDSFAPIGPVISDELDLNNTKLELRLNGTVKQSSNTNQLIFDIEYLMCFVTKIMTLNAGDIISTGTPGGIDQMKTGDKVEVIIENIGTLSNCVK